MLSSLISFDTQAHSRSQSFSQWHINGESVIVDFSILSLEVTRLAADASIDVRKDLGQILVEHLNDKIQASIDGINCELSTPLSKQPANKGYTRLKAKFNCQQGNEFRLTMRGFYDVVPAHLHYARVIRITGEASEMVLSDALRSQSVNLSDTQKDYWQVIKSYSALGMEHILIGKDHLVFLLALLLLCSRLSHAFILITGFTIGHSITLSIAVFSWFQPNMLIIEALIGFSIAVVALEKIQKLLAKSLVNYVVIFFIFLIMTKWLFNIGLPVSSLMGAVLIATSYLTLTQVDNNRAIQFLLTTAFGFIHGFGFADVLREIGLPPSELGIALLSFNVGVEFGQLLALTFMTFFILLAKKLLNDKTRQIAVSTLVSAILGLGVFWFSIRSFSF